MMKEINFDHNPSYNEFVYKFCSEYMFNVPIHNVFIAFFDVEIQEFITSKDKTINAILNSNNLEDIIHDTCNAIFDVAYMELVINTLIQKINEAQEI